MSWSTVPCTLIKTRSFNLLDIPSCKREPTKSLFYLRDFATPVNLPMKMINSNLEIWMSYWPLKNVLVKLLEQLGFNLLMKTKLLILKKLRRKSSRLRIKKKQKNQFWMKMEMRSHKKEVMQSQRVTMLLKFHNLKLKNMNGLSPTENLKIYLNSS
jgi:hypothetical protein